MAKLTKTQAARQLNISRTTLYKLIDEGKLSATPDGLIDTAELGPKPLSCHQPQTDPPWL